MAAEFIGGRIIMLVLFVEMFRLQQAAPYDDVVDLGNIDFRRRNELFVVLNIFINLK
jgi:hypothetical protein